MDRELVLAQIVSMGYELKRAEKALFITGNKGAQEAIEWLLEHNDDADIDEPITLNEADMRGADEKPLTEEEKAAKLAEIKAKIADRKAQKQREEEEAELLREKNRRESGQKAQEAMEKWKDTQDRLEIEKKKREKEEEKKHLERLREQVQRDKEERLAKMQKRTEGQDTAQAHSAAAPAAAAAPAPAAAKKPTEYTESLIQVRLPNGQTLKESFKPTDTIRTLMERIEKVKTDGEYPFQIMTTFPRKVYDASSLDMTLAAADLVPRGSVVVTKVNF